VSTRIVSGASEAVCRSFALPGAWNDLLHGKSGQVIVMELHQAEAELHVARFESLPRGERANHDWVHGRLQSPTLD
jgi:hypothetical protein